MEETLASKLQGLVFLARLYEALEHVRGETEGERAVYANARQLCADRLRKGLASALAEVKP